jgi:2-polyprenyl-3-methyl-5-hydroxy-6-metoxy-1,4-benzoquinol methylase
MYLTRNQIQDLVKKVGQPEASILFCNFFNAYRRHLDSQDMKELYDEEYFNKLKNHPHHALIADKFPLHIYNYYSYSYILTTIKQGCVLDIGCGDGDFVLALASQGFNAIGVDFDKRSIENAQKKAKLYNISAQFFCLDVVDLPDDFFVDCVVMNDVSEHLSDKEFMRVLAKAKKILKPEGRLLIHTPNGLALCNQTDQTFLQKLVLKYLYFFKKYTCFERSIEQMFYDQAHINIKSYAQLKSLLTEMNFSSKVNYDGDESNFTRFKFLNHYLKSVTSSNMLVIAQQELRKRPKVYDEK